MKQAVLVQVCFRRYKKQIIAIAICLNLLTGTIVFRQAVMVQLYLLMDRHDYAAKTVQVRLCHVCCSVAMHGDSGVW
jgi:hypothetical protein